MSMSISDAHLVDSLVTQFVSEPEPKLEISADGLPFGVFVQKCVIAFKVALLCQQLFTGTPVLTLEDRDWVFELNNRGTPVVIRTDAPFVKLSPEEAFDIIIDRVFAI